MPKTETRENRIVILVSEKEHGKLARAATKAGLSLSTFGRLALLAAAAEQEGK